MDTILYFYQKKEADSPLIEALRQDGYMLARLGMNVEPYRWFQQSLPHGRPMPPILTDEGRSPRGWEWFSLRNRKEWRRLNFHRRQWKKYENQINTLAAGCRANVEAMLSDMLKELSLYAGESSDCRCVYEKPVRDVLYGNGPVAEIWQRLWTIEEFTHYTELPWARRLMPQEYQPHFIVLGEAPCVPELLPQYADRMKSLRWLVEEAWAEAHSDELEDFAEYFYQEQGLAVSIETVQGRQGFGRLRVSCREPSTVLDFTGEDRILAGETAKGSIWLDMWSCEEKCRRFARRDAGIRYLSLREKWRRAQKKGYCLDTVDKNEYNT